MFPIYKKNSLRSARSADAKRFSVPAVISEESSPNATSSAPRIATTAHPIGTPPAGEKNAENKAAKNDSKNVVHGSFLDVKNTIDESEEDIQNGSWGSKFLLGWCYVENRIIALNYKIPSLLQNLNRGIELLEDVANNCPRIDKEHIHIAGHAAFKLYELYNGVLENKSKINGEQAAKWFELAYRLQYPAAIAIIQAEQAAAASTNTPTARP